MLFLIAAAVYFIPGLIKIWELSCESQYGPCNRTVQDEIFSYQGKSLTEVKQGLSEFFKSQPGIKEYLFQFKLPNRLLVNIIEAKAKYAIGSKEKQTFALVDADGVSLRIDSSTNLPVLLTSGNPPNLGEKVNPRELFALELVYRIFSLYQVKEGKLEGEALKVLLPDGIEVVFPLEGDRDELIGALEVILTRLKSGAKDSKIDYASVKKIDLRFKNPVLQ
ncbi:MAG TPA: hypothetical protein VJ481_00085 [Patescibacteria group bacterium]|nr:hypothetical protein [Patescibacteria group bacterium]